MNKKITIIMPFLDEGQEPVRTIQSLYDTANSDLFNVIAIDDKSGKQTEGLEKFPDLSLLRNSERLGVDMSRTKGAFYAETPFIFIIDAHMRFKDDNWLEKIIEALQDEPSSAFCTKCITLGENNMDINRPKQGFYLGADIRIYEHAGNENGVAENYRSILEPKWSKPIDKPERIYNVPCILGANYAFSKNWFMNLRGFTGLKSWGGSEVFISLKYWLSGGRCRIIKDVEIGHVFRNKAPYTTPSWHMIYNKMYIANTIFPDEMQQELVNFLGANEDTKIASEEIRKNSWDIGIAKAHYKKVFTTPMYEVLNKLNIDYKWPDGVKP